ncbi:MAG TPA: HigA family addiction module antitoxin [Verrucomicrobiae bacterium]|nr:HigA family addiction module antitoxin [Verrucomicrobiae bacterium]
MASKNIKNLNPAVCIHPGEHLKDELEARRIKQKDFASEIGIAHTQLNEIINGKRSITPDFALLLEASIGIQAQDWLNLQSCYNLEKSRVLDSNIVKVTLIETWNEVKKYVPISYFKKLGYITGKPDEDVGIIKEIYGVDDIYKIRGLIERPQLVKYRKSNKLNVELVNLVAYVKLVEFKSKKIKVNNFDKSRKNALIQNLKKVFIDINVIENTRLTLSEFGIKLITEDKPEKAPVDAIAFWSDSNPAIAVTLRFKRIDNFVFNIFHELGHIFEEHLEKENGKPIIDDLDDSTIGSIEEAQADNFAKENLIPSSIWSSFIANNNFDDNAIKDFANTVRVPAAIVRGRLCFEELLSYKSRTSISYALS